MFVPKGRSGAAAPVTQNKKNQGDDGKDDEDGPKHDGQYHAQVSFETRKYESAMFVVAPVDGRGLVLPNTRTGTVGSDTPTWR